MITVGFWGRGGDMSVIDNAEVTVGNRPSGHSAEGELRFTLNGRPVVLRNVDPKTLLIDFLRNSRTGLTGTKLSCGEGGCGACTVVLARRDPISGVVSEGPANACLRPLCSVDGMAVTTTEGIGDHRNMNPIQERLVEHNGSQCGFCTPGFVMCMYGMLRTNASPSSGDVEGFFDGNLCRCTGFRPILDAMQSFVGDPAIIRAARGRDLPLDAFGPVREFEIGDGKCTWRRVTSVSQALDAMHRAGGRSVRLVNGNTSVGIYKRPIDTTDVFLDISQIGQLRNLSVDKSGLTIGGGVTYASLIDWLNSVIPTLHGDAAHAAEALRNQVLRIAGHQVRGAATVGGAIMLVLGHVADGEPFPSDLFTVLAVLDATITLRRPDAPDGGETHPILQMPPLVEFPEGCLLTSIFVPFTGAGEHVNTYKVARRLQNSHAIVNAGFLVGLDDNRRVTRCRIVFGGLRSIAWRAGRTEQAMVGQVWDQAQAGRVQAALREETDALEIADFGDGISGSYRRSLANNLFYKFLVQVSLPKIPVDLRFADAGRTFIRPVSSGKHGTIPAPYVPGAQDAELFRLESVSAALRGELPVEPSVTYDREKSLPAGRPPPRDEAVAKILAEALTVGTTSGVAALAPLPMVKLGAELQATGEAKYTQDIALPREPLACQYVLSERSFARFSHSASVPDLLKQLRCEFPGVRDYVTFADIPKPSPANQYNPDDPGYYDPIFANVYVTAVGQPIGLILADTVRTAHAAALRMQDYIVYDTDGLAAPVLTIDDAIARGSFLKDPKSKSIVSIKRPNSDDAWLMDPKQEQGAKFVSGTQATGAQAHFYFETQSVLAVPGEIDRMTIYCSSQNVGSCQGQVASALGVSTAKIEAKALRLGGGFGGKEVRAPFFAVAAAVAAWKTGEPVRLALDRNTDMQMVGKRHPFRGDFWVSAAADGKIGKIRFDFMADAGSSNDCTLAVTDLVLLSADSAYSVPTFLATRKPCLTNTLTNTAMRSFGVIQCSLVVEEAIEKLAHKLKIAPETVRELNFYRDSTVDDRETTPYGQDLKDCRINQVWSDFKRIVDFDKRAAAVAEFNRAHRWRKRGISMIPIKYGISYTYTPYNQSGADILVFGNDGTVLVKHGGMEMGQGIHTKIARLAADALGIDIKYIEVAGTDTLDVANAPSTGASTGTDLNGGAVWMACTALRDRLKEYCKKAEPPIPDWDTQWQTQWPAIVKRANGDRVQLCSQALFKSPALSVLNKDDNQLIKPTKPDDPPPRMFYYFTYSVAASEVEIDVLTGEHSIIRADVVYDSGKTINSGLDYGQIEGGFVQGIGNVTSEQTYHAKDGKLLADGTWNYKIPCSKSIPIEFNVDLLDYIPSPDAKTPLDDYGIRSAKSTGEPPLVLESSVFFAIKHAILAAREDAGSLDWFELESPATVERIQAACLVRPDALVMKNP
jgi:xanthine dehydrogenase/oxidase